MTNLYLWAKNNLSSLEKVNKILMMVALASLAIRSGKFYETHIPKPFEVLFVVVLTLTIVDIVKNNKLKELWNSVSGNIRIALGVLFFSSIIGWLITIFFKGTPMDSAMTLEFGRFIIALLIFILVLFYAREDKMSLKKYFYALLSPVFYIIFLFSPGLAASNDLVVAGRFLGYTNNFNTISKLILIPALFFIAYSLFETKNKWLKIIYVLLSSGMVAVLLWAASRGALLALVISSLAVFAFFVVKNLSFKEVAKASVIIFSIFILGFLFAPHSGKQVVLNRVLNQDTLQTNYYGIKDESLSDIFKKSISNKNIVADPVSSGKDGNHQSEISENEKPVVFETRMVIWPFALKQAPYNLFGNGPAFNVSYPGTPISGGSHNSFIQIFFETGILGFTAFIYILFKVGQNLKNNLQLNFSVATVALSGILLSLLIALAFDDNVKTFWFWAVMAISLNFSLKNDPVDAKNTDPILQ